MRLAELLEMIELCVAVVWKAVDRDNDGQMESADDRDVLFEVGESALEVDATEPIWLVMK